VVDQITRFINVKTRHRFGDLEKKCLKRAKLDGEGIMSQTTFEAIPGMKESGWTYKDYETYM
jgi:hypothetical protein